MNASKRKDRNGPPLSAHDRDDGKDLVGVGIDIAVLDHRMAEHLLVVGQRELDGVDRVELIRGR